MQFHRRWHVPKVISFDLDDTLYDNVPVIQRTEEVAHNYIAEHYPQTAEWDMHHWRRFREEVSRADETLASDMTKLRLKSLELGLKKFGVDNSARAANTIMDVFLSERSNFEVPQESINLLEALSQQYKLIALSNGNVNADKIGLAQYFDRVIQPGDGIRGKPLPDMFAAAHQQIPGLEPYEFLHVGDHPYSDILGAQRHGWQSAWLTSGLGTKEHLSVLPTVTLHNLYQLQQLLLD
ncbi:HAD-IA family hydrolase [Idiomarina aminovorans]|jgi:FMN hydrolase / 5-amino-6-(5-phospho-D-ribitylamino)uracil phosphatase|uniref:HAD-IA family hydrolase n=1 Tax=Idiomarina aminovorans TaxID=2914829 RepID=UPI0020040135|nr:HAD-IA family hydrolase [Idiomarina sp. ATCH4]MCK7459889.1 HAD-IA family hydrolase [Idiomarina sp. ATCH4]